MALDGGVGVWPALPQDSVPPHCAEAPANGFVEPTGSGGDDTDPVERNDTSRNNTRHPDTGQLGDP
ncbi:hypothetical protein QFZ32_004697 [Streptomyces canus]|uniref:Uncharacterized protein n=1 Tax=Streptomyces canus TaxID=58343 RepID=A0AAW8FJA5_9ACTN|nr:hypothetical protein [Streptomyces canus]MDQ0909215.1 hypothetical protein [Streptomyces canus]MDQ1069257.1 hypothetical protein [Streptomyces canus]